MTLDDIVVQLGKVEDSEEFDRLWSGLGDVVLEASKRIVTERREAEPEPPPDLDDIYDRGYRAGYRLGYRTRKREVRS